MDERTYKELQSIKGYDSIDAFTVKLEGLDTDVEEFSTDDTSLAIFKWVLIREGLFRGSIEPIDRKT